MNSRRCLLDTHRCRCTWNRCQSNLHSNNNNNNNNRRPTAERISFKAVYRSQWSLRFYPGLFACLFVRKQDIWKIYWQIYTKFNGWTHGARKTCITALSLAGCCPNGVRRFLCSSRPDSRRKFKFGENVIITHFPTVCVTIRALPNDRSYTAPFNLLTCYGALEIIVALLLLSTSLLLPPPGQQQQQRQREVQLLLHQFHRVLKTFYQEVPSLTHSTFHINSVVTLFHRWVKYYRFRYIFHPAEAGLREISL